MNDMFEHNQRLFEHMAGEHDLILVESQLDEIEMIASQEAFDMFHSACNHPWRTLIQHYRIKYQVWKNMPKIKEMINRLKKESEIC